MVVSFVLGIFSANNMGNGYVKKIQFCLKKIREVKNVNVDNIQRVSKRSKLQNFFMNYSLRN